VILNDRASGWALVPMDAKPHQRVSLTYWHPCEVEGHQALPILFYVFGMVILTGRTLPSGTRHRAPRSRERLGVLRTPSRIGLGPTGLSLSVCRVTRTAHTCSTLSPATVSTGPKSSFWVTTGMP
jgi:hypothetical protein